MAVSSGFRSVLGEAAGWVFAAALAVAFIVYYDEIKRGILDGLGLPSPAAVEGDLPPESSDSRHASNSVVLRASRNGHYLATVQVNGRAIDMLVDTGASFVALSHEDAERAGVFVRPSEYTHRVSTANGEARIAMVLIDRVSIGDITVRDVQAAVSEPGRLRTSLLGMTFLKRLGRTEMRNGVLVLEE
jgi:aspartyl protease family protein